MNHRRRIFAAVAALGLVLAACGGDAASPSASDAEPSASVGGQAGGTFVFGGARLADSLDPALTSDGESFRIHRQVYETLVDLAPNSTNELIGGLAETWEGEPEDTVYTFHLREGVTFHDGTPLNAEAVSRQLRPHGELRSKSCRNSPTTTARSFGFGDGQHPRERRGDRRHDGGLHPQAAQPHLPVRTGAAVLRHRQPGGARGDRRGRARQRVRDRGDAGRNRPVHPRFVHA